MESASDEEGEVRRAGQVGNRCEAAGDEASVYVSHEHSANRTEPKKI